MISTGSVFSVIPFTSTMATPGRVEIAGPGFSRSFSADDSVVVVRSLTTERGWKRKVEFVDVTLVGSARTHTMLMTTDSQLFAALLGCWTRPTPASA